MNIKMNDTQSLPEPEQLCLIDTGRPGKHRWALGFMVGNEWLDRYKNNMVICKVRDQHRWGALG